MRPSIMLTAITGLAFAQTGQDTATQAGRKIFESQCAVCHGLTGTGGRGPALNRPKLNRAPDDTALGKLISEGIEPEMPAAWWLSPEEVAGVVVFVRSLGRVPPEKLPGDPSRGQAIYRVQGCSACHIVAGEGNGYGPELTAIGARRSAAHLRQALVDPAAFLPDEFLAVEIVTSTGEAIQGIRANEDTFTIQVKDPGGRFHSFRKEDLKELHIWRDRSAMPSYAKLKPEETDDLVAFLASLRGRE